MANEIQATYDSGSTLYALVFNAAGQIWQLTTNTFVAYVAANIDDYDIVMPEIATASGQYRGTFDADIAAGVYSVVLFEQAGGSPVVADDERIGETAKMIWDGSAEIDLDDIEAYVDKIDDGTDGLTAIKAEVEGLAGEAMRGTDSVGSGYRLGLSASYDGTTAKLGLWLEESGQRQTDVTSITDVEIWNAATDAQVVDMGDDVADSANGVFYFSGAASLAYNTPYYVKATVNKGGSPYAMQAGLVRI